MEAIVNRVAFALLVLVPLVSASIDCGAYECHGSSAYCCYLDDGDLGCCWDTSVYQLWWFWVIWVIVFFLILSCSLVCWRRRRAAQYRYVVMANSEYPTYGTVVHTSAANTYYATPSYANPNGPVPPPSAPAAPPSYAASQATKPPAYN